MVKKVKRRTNVLIIIVLIMSFYFFDARSGLCSEELNTNEGQIGEMEALPPPPDDYAEIEAKILELSEELSYKNILAAKEAEGFVENPGIITGTVKVATSHSGMSKRHSGDTIVYIESVMGNVYQPVKKSHVIPTGNIAFTKEKGLPAEPPIVDQWNVEFIPHILPVLKGSIIDFPNTDNVRHNVYSPVPIPGTDIMLSLGTYDPDVIKTIRLDNPGEIPLRCNVHQEMSAYIVVLDNPYFTLTNEKGEFTIDNVPPGNYTLKTWHEKFKPVSMEITAEPNRTIDAELPTISEKRDTSEER